MAKWRNGEMVLRIRAKVIRYNHSDKTIEHINKRSRQTRIHFSFFTCQVAYLYCITKFTLYLFDINIQSHSVSVQSTCLPNIVYKLNFITKWVRFSLRIQLPLIRSHYYVRLGREDKVLYVVAGANERRLYSQARSV